MSTILRKFRSIIAAGPRALPVNGCKMAIIVRSDIAMSRGKTASQCAHAALECYREALANQNNEAMLTMWELTGQPKIVLRVSSQTELMDLAQKAKTDGVITAIIKDAGRTQLAPGTVSVLGLGPGPKEDIDRLTSSLKLL
ncbi:peptidyl-tRNA hydrolase 2, mitochondrial [Neodiprion pinetum]|uniref:peptidyl-tRNA hydrolase n=1 Tax=Neodiprion lecontei TaxID=441921 RepID=A0A6J0C1A6_NEOLC|nr:peptidyl-tRNA hydrolase 2, mitochondrial [Neodiprion lecontei]XP_046426479.1 peptidyl-tRNA hydrolase 2, mitochondrial [Neodiprion fabricii]XP_046482873.1 peptidyl-tRNA hydrolase 2, mitochondrial [Neodiprion pinetum]XP_046620344.1 peptidyl-tRNA hydrolase 2, mitochondrial [Neodiprion virginianus]